MTKKTWVIPRDVTKKHYETLVSDAERIMGIRLTTVKHGAPPRLLTPPPQGDPWAEHILALTWPIVNVGPGWHANKEDQC